MDQPTYTSIRLRNLDAEQLREVVRGGQFEHHILGGDRFSVDHERCAAEDFSIDHGVYSFSSFVQGAFGRERVCLGFVYRQGGDTWINGHDIRPTDLQVYAAGSGIDYRAGPDTGWIGTQFSVPLLQETACRHLGRPLTLARTETINFAPPPPIFDRFQRTVRATVAEFQSGRVDVAAARDALAAAGVEAIAAGEERETHRAAERSLYRWQIIRRADEHMRRHLSSGYDSARLCEALGMTERNLQLHFGLALGLSPKAWHQRLALHAARRRLREESRWRISVSEAALHAGFRHLGRFAAAYRDLFGETPSETRRKR